jgi:hypothetical protein
MATQQQFVPGGQGPPQQQQVHPTVSYGQPGGEQAVVMPRGDQQRQWQTGNMPAAPAQQPGYPQQPWQGYGQQQAQQPQYQQPQPPVQQGYPQYGAPPQQPQPQFQGQAQQPQFSHDTILDGPGVPPELRGRTFGQAMQVYGALANSWLTRQGYQQQGQPQPQVGQYGQQQPQSARATATSGSAMATAAASSTAASTGAAAEPILGRSRPKDLRAFTSGNS